MKLRIAIAVALPLLVAAVLPAADQELLGLVMPDAKVIAGINVEQARISPFGQYLLSQVQAGGPGLEEFIGKTGFDPRQDLKEILMASRGVPGPLTGLVLARGNFDPAKIAAAAKQMGGSLQTYKGVQIVTGKEGPRTHAFAFLDNTIAIAGDAENVHEAIDRRASPSVLDPALLVLVNKTSLDEDAWTVSTVPFSSLDGVWTKDQQNPLLNGSILKTIQQASGGVKFGPVVQITGQAVARNDQDASSLADVIRFFAGMISLNAPSKDKAEVTSLLQSLNVKADASTVNVSLAIPEAQLESLISAHH